MEKQKEQPGVHLVETDDGFFVYTWGDGLLAPPARQINFNNEREILARCLYLERHGAPEEAQFLLEHFCSLRG